MSKKKIPTKKVKNIKTDKKKTVGTQVKTAAAKRTETPAELPLGKMNYILLLIGVGIIGFGFVLMSMDGFVDATEFSVSLYIAPIVVMAGFLEIIYAIMYKPKPQSEPTVDRF